MSWTLTLTDTVDTVTYDLLQVPLSEEVLEGATDVVTLDMNQYTDFFANKNLWTHTWGYMSEDDFNTLKGFYDRQFSLYLLPEITIPELGVTSIPVRMTLSPRRVIDNCGTVENVVATWRQTVQASDDWGSS